MNEQEQTIDLRVLLKVLLEHIIPIGVAAVIAAAIGFSLASFVIPKEYTASAMLYVESNAKQSNDTELNVNAINAAQKIVNTCQILFTSDYVLGELSKSLGNAYTPAQLDNMIKIQSVNSTEILEISVKSGYPENSKVIVDNLVVLSVEEFQRVIKSGSISVVSQAETPKSHTYPSVMQFTVIGFAIGLLGCYFIFLIIEILDSKVKADDDLAAAYGIPVFAEIMDFESTSKAGYNKYDYSYGYGGHHKDKENSDEETAEKKSENDDGAEAENKEGGEQDK